MAKPTPDANGKLVVPLAPAMSNLGPPLRNKELTLGVAGVNSIGRGPTTMATDSIVVGQLPSLPEAFSLVEIVP